MGDLLTGVEEQAPQYTLFSDGIALKGETLSDLITQLGLQQQALEPNGWRINGEIE